VAHISLASMAEALVKLDTSEQNECHAPFLGNYSIMSKSTCACESDVALGLHRMCQHALFSQTQSHED